MAKNTLTFSSVTRDDGTVEYEAEYTGGSGILQMRCDEPSHVRVLGDAGAGYMEIYCMQVNEAVYAVNMDGFNKMKFVSEGTVDECIINEF